jgi:hypothetical protein
MPHRLFPVHSSYPVRRHSEIEDWLDSLPPEVREAERRRMRRMIWWERWRATIGLSVCLIVFLFLYLRLAESRNDIARNLRQDLDRQRHVTQKLSAQAHETTAIRVQIVEANCMRDNRQIIGNRRLLADLGRAVGKDDPIYVVLKRAINNPERLKPIPDCHKYALDSVSGKLSPGEVH